MISLTALTIFSALSVMAEMILPLMPQRAHDIWVPPFWRHHLGDRTCGHCFGAGHFGTTVTFRLL